MLVIVISPVFLAQDRDPNQNNNLKQLFGATEMLNGGNLFLHFLLKKKAPPCMTSCFSKFTIFPTFSETKALSKINSCSKLSPG